MAIDWTKCRESKSGNIITPKARMSYPHLFRAQGMDGSEPKFSLSLLIPGASDIVRLKQAAEAMAKEKWPNGVKNLRSPFLDAEEKDDGDHAKGMVLIRASSKQKPGLVDARGNNVEDEAEVYAGRWCVASLRCFAYDRNGNRGVSFGLQNVQLLDHDEPIGGGRVRAEDEFEAVSDDEVSSAASADSVFSSGDGAGTGSMFE